MAVKSRYIHFLLLTVLLGFISTMTQAQDKQVVRLNEHFYPINENDSSNYFYKAILVNLTDSTSIERIFNLKNQIVKITRYGYNMEGNFPEESTETYDSKGKLSSKKIKNTDNGLFLTKYYLDGEYVGEALFTEARNYEIRKLGSNAVMTTEQNEFEPSPLTDKVLWQKHLIKNLSYPTKARSIKAEGTVKLALLVNAEGELTTIEVANSTEIHESLVKEAIRVAEVYKGRFLPGRDLNGNPVDSWLYVPLRFKLD